MNTGSPLRPVRPLAALAVALLALVPPALAAQTKATANDPRVGLGAGRAAQSAFQGLRLVSNSPKPPELDPPVNPGLSFLNTDLAFRGTTLYQGNFSGFQIWDVANPARPVLKKTIVCGTDQGDPSIWGNLLFISSEATRGRTDCGTQGVQGASSPERMRGIRIYDVADPLNPKLIKNVQTCRGSHTHTVVPDPKDPKVVYIYVSGQAPVRPSTELAECVSGPAEDPASARYRIEVIRVPVDRPQDAAVVSSARIFADLAAPPKHGAASAAGAAPDQCHDITVYPAIGLGAGACGGYGILLDIRDPMHPVRLQAVGDSNFAYWHSATFNNDGTSLLFTDEWGGGTMPRCRDVDPLEWGGNVIFSLHPTTRRLTHGSYFKIPAIQTAQENCVAHNGSLIPVPGRDLLVQGWYQGGVSVVDFTDPSAPKEVAWFDRGPMDSTRLVLGGSWGAYWYNGLIYSSELARGLDILDLVPTPLLSANEIAAAKLVRWEEFNPQSQPKIVWPAAFPVVRSYLDQLVRDTGLPVARTTAIASAITAAEQASGPARRTALTSLATALDRDATSARQPAKVRAMAAAVRDLADATR